MDINFIENALAECDSQIKEHKSGADKAIRRLWMAILVAVALVFIVAFGAYTWFREIAPEIAKQLTAKQLIDELNIIFFLLGTLVVILLGIFVSLHKFHLREAARYKRYKIGFYRILTAATNKSKGFQSEVRISLTDNAFDSKVLSQQESKKKIESPLPGHPSTELITSVVNSVIDHMPSSKALKKTLTE